MMSNENGTQTKVGVAMHHVGVRGMSKAAQQAVVAAVLFKNHESHLRAGVVDNLLELDGLSSIRGVTVI